MRTLGYYETSMWTIKRKTSFTKEFYTCSFPIECTGVMLRVL
jgi:hypothetical protein